MSELKEKLKGLYDRIPRRHTTENVKEANSVLDDYEDLLTEIEADGRYENQVASFFEAIAPIRVTFKNQMIQSLPKKQRMFCLMRLPEP